MGAHLVGEDAESPHVRGFRLLLSLPQLRRQVVRGADALNLFFARLVLDFLADALQRRLHLKCSL